MWGRCCFLSVCVHVSSADYTDLAMSTVKQTQAIPYTGPFNLLSFQLQKLTGVCLPTVAPLSAVSGKTMKLPREGCCLISVVVSEVHRFYLHLVIPHLSELLRIYSPTFKSRYTFHPRSTENSKNIGSRYSLCLKSALATQIPSIFSSAQ